MNAFSSPSATHGMQLCSAQFVAAVEFEFNVVIVNEPVVKLCRRLTFIKILLGSLDKQSLKIPKISMAWNLKFLVV